MEQNRTLIIPRKTRRMGIFAVEIRRNMEIKDIYYIDEDVALMTDVSDLSEYNGAKMDSTTFFWLAGRTVTNGHQREKPYGSCGNEYHVSAQQLYRQHSGRRGCKYRHVETIR